MIGQTVVLSGEGARQRARALIDAAPPHSVVNVRPATRSRDQNAKLWAMLSDISRHKPDGRTHTPETWKALFMHACGYSVQFEMGLTGEPFPVGFRSSRMSKEQMAELITFVASYGDEHGVRWSG